MEVVEHVREQMRLTIGLGLEKALNVGAVRGDAVYAQPVEHFVHVSERSLASIVVHDNLREHRVEEARHLDTLANPRLNARVLGPNNLVDLARCRKKPIAAILGVKAHLDGVPNRFVQIIPRNSLASSLTHHPFHQVDSAAFLGDAMLHLKACVHFQEVELLRLLVVEELHRASAPVAHALRETFRRSKHAGAHLVGKVRRRAFLNHLLIAALHRAVALGNRRRAGCVAKNLHLHVARTLDVLLKKHVAVAEVCLGEMARALEGALEFARVVADLDADTATARGRLEHHGVADLVRRSKRLVNRRNEPRAGGQRHARLLGNATRHMLQTELFHLLRLRADEHDTLSRATAGELYVLT